MRWAGVFFVSLFLSSTGFAYLDGYANDCTELKPGASLFVNRQVSFDPTPVPRNFKLTRDLQDPQLYYVDLNMDFLITDEALLEKRGVTAIKYLSPNDRDRNSRVTAKQVVTAEMREAMIWTTRKCFAEMKDKITSPDGTKLRFRASFKNDIPELPFYPVQVSLDRIRASSREWSWNSRCSTIIHESLHQLGLVDGYKERGGNQFDCRSIEPGQSLMHTSAAIYPLVNLRICKGQSTLPRLVQKVQGDLPQCPLDTEHLDFPFVEEADFYHDPAALPPGSQIYYQDVVSKGFALYPAQMRMITKPHCVTENIKYLNCAYTAYYPSADVQCPKMQSYCSTDEYLQ